MVISHSAMKIEPPESFTMTSRYPYRVGSSLSWNDPTYIERQADVDLHYALQVSHFCYVLGPGQIGKSSLRVRTSHRLKQRGYRCVTVDAAELSNASQLSQDQSPQHWYTRLITSIWDGLAPTDSTVFLQWIEATAGVSPQERLDRFAREILFTQYPNQPLVIWVDQVECWLDLPFPVHDFFEWIWRCYRFRDINPAYRRLRFAVLGTASPSDLTPNKGLFAAGCSITLDNFQLVDTRYLRQGLEANIKETDVVLQNILRWTNGQPLLTQKLCQIVSMLASALMMPYQAPFSLSPAVMPRWIDWVVQWHLIKDWRSQDNPLHFHLGAISDRLTRHPLGIELLTCYEKICTGHVVTAQDDPIQTELLHSGIVYIQGQKLQIANEIYRQVFDPKWVAQQILEHIARYQA